MVGREQEEGEVSLDAAVHTCSAKDFLFSCSNDMVKNGLQLALVVLGSGNECWTVRATKEDTICLHS